MKILPTTDSQASDQSTPVSATAHAVTHSSVANANTAAGEVPIATHETSATAAGSSE